MTRDNIIRMAKEVGMDAMIGTVRDGKYIPKVNALKNSVPVEWLEDFAKLVSGGVERDLSCSLSGHGILIHGDSKSIERVKSALHAEFETVPTLREEIRVLRQKLGSSKRRVKKIEEDSNLEAWALEGRVRWLQEKENTGYQGCV